MRHFRVVPAATLLVLSASSLAGAQVWYPPYPYYRYAQPESDVRILVKPNEASVYVDGYFAGKVDDFDGTFQRLHVIPGAHEITIYLEGYKSLTEKLYLSPRGTRKIEGTLEKLAPGEPNEPIPTPAEPPPGSNLLPRDRQPPRRVPRTT
jgi:hypothetical protein